MTYSLRFVRKIPIYVTAEVEGDNLEEAIQALRDFPDYPDDIPITMKACGPEENDLDNIEVYSRDEGRFIPISEL